MQDEVITQVSKLSFAAAHAFFSVLVCRDLLSVSVDGYLCVMLIYIMRM